MAKKEKKKLTAEEKAEAKAEKASLKAEKKAAKKPKAKKEKVVKSKDPVEVQKQRWNVYTTMSLVTFIGLIIACLFLHFELDKHGYKSPTSSSAKR